jgi:hypothetical protein
MIRGMKRIAAVSTLFILAACSSSKTYPVMPPPEIDLVQLYGPADLNYARGTNSIEAQYGVQIRNPSTDPITLKHITLESVAGTTIVVRREDRSFNNEIPPGQVGQAVVNARVYFTSDLSGSPTREPLTLRATLHFDSPKGPFNRIVQKVIGQFPGQ